MVALGWQFAENLKAGDVVGLCGDLGTGKTHFVKGLAASLGAKTEVNSPTFTLVHEYTGGRLPVFHCDFYRLNTEAEVVGIGFDDYLDEGGVLVIEWADKFRSLLPAHTRWIQFRHTERDEREVDMP